MKLIALIAFITVFKIMIIGQQTTTLIADGTVNVPQKYPIQPEIKDLKKVEIDFVKNEVVNSKPEINFSPQMNFDEIKYLGDFNLIDVAEGFFVSREIMSKAFLYMAWNEKQRRNYQGVMVVRSFQNGTKFNVAAHYVYQSRNDRFIRQLPDINRNFLSELAIFDEPPTKKIERKGVRIIEFSQNGLEKLGQTSIYFRQNKPQRMPWEKDGTKSVKRVYDPPEIRGMRLFAENSINNLVHFSLQEFYFSKDKWYETKSVADYNLESDQTKYLELVKAKLP